MIIAKIKTICPGPPKSTSPIKMFSDEFQDTEFKSTLINFNNEFKDTKRHLCILPKSCPRGKKKTNLRLNETRKTIQDLETKVMKINDNEKSS